MHVESGSTFIYGLVDPRTGKIRYVGKSNNPAQRIKDHISERRRNNSPKCKWIQELWDSDLRPVMHIVMKVPYERRTWFEQRVMDQNGGIENLLNLVLAYDSAPPPWNEEHRKHHKEAAERSAHKRSERSKEMWATPEFRERRAKGVRKAKAEGKYVVSPEERKARSDRMKQVWNDPNTRKKRVESIIQGWNKPERHERLSEWNKENWNDPDYRKEMTAKNRVSRADPEVKEKCARANQERWANPEEHKKQSERSKRRWADPAARKRQSETLKKARARKREEQ